MYVLRDAHVYRIADGAIIPKDPENRDYQGYLSWLTQGNQPEIDAAPSLEDAKDQVRREIQVFAAQYRDQLIGPISPGEAASWIQKEIEARKFLITRYDSDAPSLRAEAQHRGISIEELATKVIGNADHYRYLEAQVAGTRGRHDDAIALLQTVEEVTAYNWRSGWGIE